LFVGSFHTCTTVYSIEYSDERRFVKSVATVQGLLDDRIGIFRGGPDGFLSSLRRYYESISALGGRPNRFFRAF
jgi:hypothetical protein